MIESAVGTGIRDNFDFYPTQPETVELAVPYINTNIIVRALDVGCGYGVWGEVLHKTVPSISLTGVDIQKFPTNSRYKNWYTDFDFLEYGHKDVLGEYELIFGNPPFKHAQEMVEMSYDMLTDGGQLLFLLRLGFLGSQKRFDFFKRLPPQLIVILSKRPSFVENSRKTDTYEYMLVKWVKGYSGEPTLKWAL